MADSKDKDRPDEPDLSADDPAQTPTDAGQDDGGGNVVDGKDRDTDGELVGVGATRSESRRSERSGAGDGATTSSAGRQKKTEATPKQRQDPDRPRRTGPVTFIKESIAELRKVVYPTGQQLLNYFIVVLVFVLFIIGLVSVLDYAFGQLMLLVFGG